MKAEQFIEQKEQVLCEEYQVGSVSIDQGLINLFYENLQDYIEDPEHGYTERDLKDAWDRADFEFDERAKEEEGVTLVSIGGYEKTVSKY